MVDLPKYYMSNQQTYRRTPLGFRYHPNQIANYQHLLHSHKIKVKNQTPLPELQDAGGWNGVAMPMRYIEKPQVASVRRRKELA
jgi:hypothetical protein